MKTLIAEKSAVCPLTGWAELLNWFCLAQRLWTFHHPYAIALRIVLNFVHDVVDQQHASARGLEEIGRITRVRNLVQIETFSFVFNGKASFVGREFCGDSQQFGRIVLVAVLDGVDEGFIQSNEQI